MTENVTGVFGFNGRSLTAPGTRVVSANGEDTIRIIGSAAEWHALMDQMNRYYHPHPPVDDVDDMDDTDDVPVETNPDMIRIDDIHDVRDGDKVHVKGSTEAFECVGVNRNDIHSTVLRLHVSLHVSIDSPWIGSVGTWTYVWLRNEWFDYAERPKPVPTSLPSFPDDDLSWHWFVGADGTKVLYSRTYTGDNLPWRVEGNGWLSSGQLIANHTEVFPLTELTADDADSGSGSV